ncbi:protein zwilch homolog [Amazona ochrocephala]
MEAVSLTGITPVQMLLEIGLDKMKKDCQFFHRICIKYYRENPLDEKHVFQLPVSSALVKTFYPDSHPEVWKVDISSGHGPKEVKTTWQVSTNPPVEHMMSNSTGLLSDSTVNAGIEEKMYFITVVKCSQVHFR